MTGSREINQTEDGEILSSTVTGGAEKTLSVLGSIILTVFFVFFLIIRSFLVSPL